MCKEKEVLLTLDEKKRLYELIQKYEEAITFKDSTRSYLFEDAKSELEDYLNQIDFKLRFPGRDEIVEYDIKAIHDLFIRGYDADIDKREIQVLDTDKEVLEANISSIIRVLEDYNQETPWTEHETETLMMEIKDTAHKLEQLIEKLGVIDTTDPALNVYFKRICLK